MTTSETLTKHPLASLREVTALSLPFILVLFAGSLMGLCDRLILARYSLEALEASISAFYILQLFQIPCVRIASTAQIFVGQYKGGGQDNRIGPAVWQMIWFSILSMVILTPLSGPISRLFFKDTLIQEGGLSYFHCLMTVNFLFPLGAALSSFYLGQGQTKRVLLASLLSHAGHILLDFPLIFGIEGLIPAMGVKGAALASGIAQAGFCAVLFCDFLKPLYRHVYLTACFAFHWASFWRYLRVGIPRAGSKIILLIAWAGVTHIMIHKQEDYLAVLAFGGTLNLFYTCFNEGMSQALTTIGAYLIGAKRFILWKLIKSASFFLIIGACILAIPCLIFPDSIITLFFKENPSAILREELRLSCFWLWLLFITHGFNLIFLGLLNSYGDTLFQFLFAVSLGWMTHFFPVYLAIELNHAPPNQLWLIMAAVCLFSAGVYFLRFRQEKWRQSYPLGAPDVYRKE